MGVIDNINIIYADKNYTVSIDTLGYKCINILIIRWYKVNKYIQKIFLYVIILMISDSENNTSITLNQGINFKNYQKKINNSVAKQNKNFIEGFDGTGSQFLQDNKEQVQNATQELDALKIQFSSLLERYNTSNTQTVTTTKNFINEPPPANPNIGKNLYVNSMVQNNEADYIGAYNDDSNKPSMTRLPSVGWSIGNYESCKNEAIRLGKQYFGLEGIPQGAKQGSTTPARMDEYNNMHCSVTSNIDDVTKYGKNIPKCNIDNADGKIYGNNMINAFYKADGTYMGCYNDKISKSYDSLPNCFYNCYSGANDTCVWKGAGFIDKTASWIWYTPNYYEDAPVNIGFPETIITSYENSSTININATLYSMCDDMADIYLNSTYVGNVNGIGLGIGGSSFPIILIPGTNYIYAEVTNSGGPGGFVFSVLTPDKKVLFNSYNGSKYTNIRAQSLINNLDNAFSGRAMEPSGPIFSSFTSVYLLGSFNMGPWSAVNFIDNTASWIWWTQNAQYDAPANSVVPVTLVTTFNYTGSSFLNATIYCMCDNFSSVYLNSSLVGNVINGWEGGGSGIKFPILISPGMNSVYAEVLNYGGPAGFIMTILDGNNKVLFNTDSSWKFTIIRANMLNKSNTDFTVDSCKKYANDNGFSYFGVQGGVSGSSQCYVGNNRYAANRYGSVESVLPLVGQGGVTRDYGTKSVNTVYKLKEVGYPENMGKIGYIDKNGAVAEYPSTSIEPFTNIKNDLSCPKGVVNIDSIQWQTLSKSDLKMGKNTKCGLAVAVEPDQLSSSDLGKQLESMSSKIIGLINYLGGVDSKLIEQSGINKTVLTDMLSQYKNYNIKISQYKDFDSRNINGVLSDSKITILHENYMYIIWFVLAIIFITITIRFYQKSLV